MSAPTVHPDTPAPHELELGRRPRSARGSGAVCCRSRVRGGAAPAPERQPGQTVSRYDRPLLAVPSVVGRFNPVVKDMVAMFGWFDTGRYVADPRRQEQLFGPVPTAEEALARFADERVAHRRSDVRN
ncbi:hypothetical protein ACWKT3_16690 [Streptomyces violaceus]